MNLSLLLMISSIIFFIVVVETIFRPRLDKTEEGNLLLWYGRSKRSYVKIY
jgi:hypothetical protein